MAGKSNANGTANRIEGELAEIERKAGKGLEKHLAISAPNIEMARFKIVGTAPYVQCKFPQKAINQIRETQEAGSTAKKGKKRDPKDFQEAYRGAMHKSPKGEYGIPASAFRNAMISACRMAGFQMTRAKLSVFVEADFFDAEEGTPLVRINGEPEYSQMAVRNATGVVDLRARPMWREWSATVTVRYDADQFTQVDVANLLARVGMQVGIGEGRPDSKNSAGMGWGLFRFAAEGE